MGGTTSTTNTSQQQKVELPAWVDQASQENYQMAKDVSGRPLQQYEGDRVAGPSDMTTQGYGMLTAGAGAENPMYSDAANLFKSSAGDLDISKYLNPYTNEVEQRAIGNANTSLTQQLNDIAGKASQNNVFGGTRMGVQQGVAQAEGVKNIGDLSATIRQTGFDSAAALAQAEKARQTGAAQGLLSTASGQQGSRITDATSLLAAGQQDTAARQKVIDAAMGKFAEAQNYPTEQLNMRLAALGMSPYGKTTTGTGTSSTDTPVDWATVGLGGLKALPGLIGTGATAGAGGSGLLGLLAMSDRNTKTDITKLTDGEIPLYSYRYKDDPKTYPKVVGPMAQDIEKKYPKAIKKVGRYKTIDINNLMEVLS
jgi:hypothetical protein